MDRSAEVGRAFGAAAVVWLASHLGYLAITLVSRMGDPGWIGLRSALATAAVGHELVPDHRG